MSTLAKPFAALRPRPETAQSVIAPPYDVVDTDEARSLTEDRPESFLHISRPEIDFSEAVDPHSEAVYAKGASNLNALIERNVLQRESRPACYVYRLTDGDHQQTGVAFAASLAAYRAGRIHRHELTRPDKETDRVRNIESLNAQTGPVMLAYRADSTVDEILAAAASKPALLEATGQHDVVHTLWRIDDDDEVTALTEAIDALGDLYIADGHHRSAAAARVADSRNAGGSPGNASHDYFLSVAFPDDQMQIFDYNRVVSDLNGMDASELLLAIEKIFTVESSPQPAKPSTRGEFGMYVDGNWYRLREREPAQVDDPVENLDISLLQRTILGPLLGIGDPRIDDRIAFVGGVRGLGDLERRVDGGSAAVAFAIYPTSLRDLFAVADADQLMPPKSTWFEPKLADGLLTHVLD